MGFFESLLFRLGLVEPASLSKLSKILVSYKSLVNKIKLKIFCFEMVNRNYQKGNDYELTWAFWLLKEFKIQPTKEIYSLIFKSESVCASLIALDLINQNTLIKSFDYSHIEKLFCIENLNKQYWLLIYECIFKNWLHFIPTSIVSNHFYFETLRSNGVYFYDANKTLEPLTVENSYFDKIDRKISQVDKYIQHNEFKNDIVNEQIKSLSNLLQLSKDGKKISQNELQKRLESSDLLIKKIIANLDELRLKQTKFENKRMYFVLGKRLEELGELTTKEINLQSKQDKDLLFDPEYE